MNDMRKLMEAVELDEVASSEQWEIAINNLIADGDKQWERADSMEQGVWDWVRGELHGMLDYQPDKPESELTSTDRWPGELTHPDHGGSQRAWDLHKGE